MIPESYSDFRGSFQFTVGFFSTLFVFSLCYCLLFFLNLIELL